MSIFDLLGAAGAGLTRGAVQGEQAKIQQLRQQQQDQMRRDQLAQQSTHQNAQLDLQRQGLDLRKKEQAEKIGRMRQQAILNMSLSARNALVSDPRKLADLDAQGQLQGVLDLFDAGIKLGSAPDIDDAALDAYSDAFGTFLKSGPLSDHPEVQRHFGAQPAQAPAQQNVFPAGAQTIVNLPGMERYIQQHVPMVAPTQEGGPRLYSPPDYNLTPQLKMLLDLEANGQPGGVSISDLPPQPEGVRDIPKPAPRLFPYPPSIASEIAARNAQTEASEARTETENLLREPRLTKTQRDAEAAFERGKLSHRTTSLLPAKEERAASEARARQEERDRKAQFEQEKEQRRRQESDRDYNLAVTKFKAGKDKTGADPDGKMSAIDRQVWDSAEKVLFEANRDGFTKKVTGPSFNDKERAAALQTLREMAMKYGGKSAAAAIVDPFGRVQAQPIKSPNPTRTNAPAPATKTTAPIKPAKSNPPVKSAPKQQSKKAPDYSNMSAAEIAKRMAARAAKLQKEGK